MGFIVFTNPVNLKYKTVICSKATAFYILCCLLTIIPPLLVAYRSEGNQLNSITSHVLKQNQVKWSIQRRFNNVKIDPWLICLFFYNIRLLEENRCLSWTARCTLWIWISVTFGNRFRKFGLEYISWIQRAHAGKGKGSNT